MANACFRCRASIPSGGTFCPDCASEVSIGETTPAVVSRWWLLVAAATLGLPVGIGLGALGSVVGVWAVGSIGSLLVFVSWGGFLLGLGLDGQALQRAEAAWAPSTWVLMALVIPAVFVLPIPLVGAYYLHRRQRGIGLNR